MSIAIPSGSEEDDMAQAQQEIRIDNEGYLIDPAEWNEKVACALAERAGIEELKPDMMEIIRFLRDYYMKYDFFPILGHVCRNIHEPKDCLAEKFIEPLVAYKVAGLPRPIDQLKEYLEGGAGIV